MIYKTVVQPDPLQRNGWFPAHVAAMRGLPYVIDYGGSPITIGTVIEAEVNLDGDAELRIELTDGVSFYVDFLPR